MFAITYEIVTYESAEHGDASERGYVDESCTLREAYDRLRFEGTPHADCYPLAAPRWLTFPPAVEFTTGSETYLTLHLPRNLSESSRLRIARLFGVTK